MFNILKNLSWPELKALALFVGVFVLSACPVFIDIPSTYFSSKRSFINVYFVKYGWGWTLSLLCLYILPGIWLQFTDWKPKVRDALSRILILTGLWYVYTIIIFGTVQKFDPKCHNSDDVIIENITDHRSCMKLPGKHRWMGFDISGHAFILTLTPLMIASELQIKYWATLRISENTSSIRHKAAAYLKMLFILNCVLSILWIFSLACTCLYFHVFMSKILGAFFGIFSWWISYSKLFPFLLISPRGNNGTGMPETHIDRNWDNLISQKRNSRNDEDKKSE